MTTSNMCVGVLVAQAPQTSSLPLRYSLKVAKCTKKGMSPTLAGENEAHEPSTARCTPNIIILDHSEMRSTMYRFHEDFGYVVEEVSFLENVAFRPPFYLHPLSIGAVWPGNACK
jgi:hypothetical protein